MSSNLAEGTPPWHISMNTVTRSCRNWKTDRLEEPGVEGSSPSERTHGPAARMARSLIPTVGRTSAKRLARGSTPLRASLPPNAPLGSPELTSTRTLRAASCVRDSAGCDVTASAWIRGSAEEFS